MFKLLATLFLLVAGFSQPQSFEEGESVIDGEQGALGIVTGVVQVTSLSGEVRQDRSKVVVFLEGAHALAESAAIATALISQEDGSFSPAVLPIVAGTSVAFPNEDRVFHNIFSLSRARPFDLGVYGSGETRSIYFPETGLVQVFCNIHPDMAASVLVLNNQYHAVTDEAGAFQIHGVPPGIHTLRTWHRVSGEHRQEVTVHAGGETVVEIELQEDRRVLPHANKFGRRYRRKY